MACFHLRQAFYPIHGSGSNKLIWDPDDPNIGLPVTIPCRQCIGCRLDYSKQWAIRCVNESQLYEKNCFITLTFSDEGLKKRWVDDGVHPSSLCVRDFQLFMKRYRKFFGNGIRFFHSGEYGDLYGRPHYHALMFNTDLPDRKFLKMSNGLRLDKSEILAKLWPYGHVSVGSVTFNSAAYCARYVMKKINGKDKQEHYEFLDVDLDSGELLQVVNRKQDYCTMSRRPGIGKLWFDKYIDDIYPSDEIVLPGGRKFRVPKYYDSQYELLYPEDFALLKQVREESAIVHADNNTPERLIVREKVQAARLGMLIRSL